MSKPLSVRRLPKSPLASCAISLVFMAQVGAAHATGSCESLASVTIPFATITTAQSVPAGTFTPPIGAPINNLPAFCRVALTMAPSADSSIRVEVWMPTVGWTGRYQGTGGGGYTGSISYGALAAGLNLGNAVANTDMGTVPATVTNGTSLVGHPEKWLDFGSRSTHEMTVAGKFLVQAFYGQPANYSYFTGCSTGGHQGLEEAQVFPDDYDGILAGAPGHNRTHLHMTFVNNYKVPHTAPGSVISASKLTMLNQAVLNACVGKDGGVATDGFLTDPRKCGFDPATLLCTTGDAPSCLTASEVYTAKAFYDGLRNPRTGALIYPGWARGTETGWGGLQGTTSPAFPGILNWALGANYNPLTVDWDQDSATVDATLAPTVNFMSTDLSRFSGHNGKLILYHGFADPIVVTRDTITYYDRLRDEQGLSPEQLQSFARLFLVPGMGHCSGGPGPNTFDALTPLFNWVENGKAPESIVATRSQGGTVLMSRPLCAYPKEAHYLGSGATNDAANFACVDDGTNDPSLENPAREYLSPLIIQASAPEALNLRNGGGKVVIVLSTPEGSDTFRQWLPSDIKAEGAAAMSGKLSDDGKQYVVQFNRVDLQSFNGGNPDRQDVDLMITGNLQHNGVRSLFATSATVKVSR
jgi:feruloyl esterase